MALSKSQALVVAGTLFVFSALCVVYGAWVSAPRLFIKIFVTLPPPPNTPSFVDLPPSVRERVDATVQQPKPRDESTNSRDDVLVDRTLRAIVARMDHASTSEMWARYQRESEEYRAKYFPEYKPEKGLTWLLAAVALGGGGLFASVSYRKA